MTDLAGFRTRARQVLGDPAGTRFGDDLLDEALQWALAAYGKVLPQVKVGCLTVTTAEREQSLAELAGLVNILEVNYPYVNGGSLPLVFEKWYFYMREAAGYLYLGGGRAPRVGDVLRLVYTTRHTITGLNGAEQTSIPGTDEYMFANGAAGKAAMTRGVHLVEAYGNRISEPQKLQNWAEKMVMTFLSDLNTLKRSPLFAVLSPAGWRLDEWDR